MKYLFSCCLFGETNFLLLGDKWIQLFHIEVLFDNFVISGWVTDANWFKVLVVFSSLLMSIIFLKIFMNVLLSFRYNPDGAPYKIRREITREAANHSRWYLNGRLSNQKNVGFRYHPFLLNNDL